MLKTTPIKPLTNQYLESIGFSWHTDLDGTDYISNDILDISSDEAEAYYEAGNELYDMFVKAGEYVIQNDLLSELDIPFNLIDLVKMSWENDVHWHLYGRFDLAGGIDGRDIKLIEFNADTPTSLFESTIIQWAMLKANGLDEESQFNSIYEAIGENFKRLVTLDESTEDFDTHYPSLRYKILFSSIASSSEDEYTTRLLEHIASEVGFETSFEFVEDVEFSDDGIFDKDGVKYDYWFKLIPWEDIAIDEGELAVILSDIIANQQAIILNPAYTLMFQSKGFMKILWDLFPNHPLLLETDFEPLECDFVHKRCFGREGANTAIVCDGEIIEQTDGDYENFKEVFQEYTKLATDNNGDSYQAGLFFAFESCGLGFRKGGKILNNMSKFVPHKISD
jgi:glutathionylspermidine synthase